MNLTKFIDNNNRVKSFDPWVNSLFDNLFYDSALAGKNFSRVPAVNIAESEKGYHLEFAVPGFSKEDVKIHVENEVLTVSGEHKVEEGSDQKKYGRKEFSYTSFKRSFTLPESVDVEQIEANLKDGVLSVEVAKKAEEKPLVKEIAVK